MTPKSYTLLEFEFAQLIRPVEEDSEAEDGRELGVHFRKVSVFPVTSNERLDQFDFTVSTPANACTIHGLSGLEAGGVWNQGPSARVLLWRENALPSTARIEFEHSLPGCGGARLHARVRANGGKWSEVYFEGGAVSVEIEILEQPKALKSDVAPALSVIVLNYERTLLTYASVMCALYSTRWIDAEVIVVDNGSLEPRSQDFCDMDLPAKLLRLDRPVSFASANNFSVEAARGKYLLFLNNDAFLKDGVVEKLLAEMAPEDVGAVGPIFVNADGSFQELSRDS
jgi:hypothetical protein